MKSTSTANMGIISQERMTSARTIVSPCTIRVGPSPCHQRFVRPIITAMRIAGMAINRGRDFGSPTLLAIAFGVA